MNDKQRIDAVRITRIATETRGTGPPVIMRFAIDGRTCNKPITRAMIDICSMSRNNGFIRVILNIIGLLYRQFL